jgi:hypothetical protein
VGLVRALGGGWSAADLPTEEAVLPFGPLDIADGARRPRPDGTGVGAEEAFQPP